ncbi:L-glutaminase [Dethiosulfatibacter aminovorans DSM 17477]|uniref:Glutaminase n=1 Tax=Dethiosulfatibacter aminovorans DSM 17477 TaxID=1121476 RepID=A0A1M6HDG7_9FIRM|nr:glutaminase A [Dethiosulfatibacter aminovorans]SHJ20260.1 L-glutaminase [Dethiosulfatibacter aminovorans DSM 17477]
MERILEKIINKNIKDITLGEKASYIPELKNVPDKLGISIMTSEGTFSAGDAGYRFTFQSMSKVLMLMVALQDNGYDYVFNHVGLEPSGDSFNSISKLDFNNVIKPYNPFINAGAILTASMIRGSSYDEKLSRVRDLAECIFMRRDIGFNDGVYTSERDNANRNRALAYLLKEKGLLKGNVEEILDLYFRICSLEVSCTDLASLGHLLAFNDEKCGIDMNYLRIIKTLMLTCGMYDYSGEFAVKIGIPSKSGVSGGILSCVPGRMGIGVFSPRLDEKGNSILGVRMIEELNEELGLNIFV